MSLMPEAVCGVSVGASARAAPTASRSLPHTLFGAVPQTKSRRRGFLTSPPGKSGVFAASETQVGFLGRPPLARRRSYRRRPPLSRRSSTFPLSRGEIQ